MKNITINGNEQKTSLDENFKMTLEPITDFSTQLKVLNIESLDELKNAKGTFRIEVNDNVNEYKFEIEAEIKNKHAGSVYNDTINRYIME